ncbi:MAG: hypothetical protein BGO76_07850 [Caedibacter sp. 38-128]|nr:hypothetical protein [Holosporales bacterium]OJX04913.1 MAG: hypothetical protein BGO76_07850 [Caedibacter sp. 38-128]
MKNFRGVIVSFLFLLSMVAGAQTIKASDIYENQRPDSKQLARLQKNLEYLQLPLSKLQILLMDNPFQDEKKKGSQYLSLEEARGLGECLYFFSVQENSHKSDYLKILQNQKYQEQEISPLTMRVLGAHGREDKDYYQGTYEIRHGSFPPFRFHILAIEQKKEQQLKGGVAFYILSGNSRQNSVQLSALCKEEYAVTKAGQLVDEEGNLIKSETERWFSLEEVIGEQIPIPTLPAVKEKPSKKKRKAFTRGEAKPVDPLPLPSQSIEAESSLPQTDLAKSSSSTSEIIKGKKTPSYRGVNYSLLRREAEDLLRSIHEQVHVQGEGNEPPFLENSSTSLISSKEIMLTQELPMPSPSDQVSSTVQNEGDRTSSPSVKRGRNNAFVDLKVEDLTRKK